MCVSVVVPSGTVQAVSTIVASSTSISVSWSEVLPIDRNGEQIVYEIVYRPENTFGGAIPAVNSRNVSETVAELINLQEFMLYNVSIRSYTVVGPGPFSFGVTNQTLEAGRQTVDIYYIFPLVIILLCNKKWFYLTFMQLRCMYQTLIILAALVLEIYVVSSSHFFLHNRGHQAFANLSNTVGAGL